MILYFSATGNSKYVARMVADATQDRVMSLTNIQGEIVLTEKENLGIVTPVYYWRLPFFVEELMEKISIQGSKKRYVFFIGTYGTTCGQSGTFMKKQLEKKGFQMNAAYSVKMPESWTPMYDVSDKEKVAEINAAEIPQIERIVGHIKNGDSGNYMKDKMPMIGVKLARPFYENATKTSHFRVEDSCIGCGLCAKNCPVQAIKMQDQKPVWMKEKCAMCLSCLHHCPKFAIQYGRNTKKHGQYVHFE